MKTGESGTRRIQAFCPHCGTPIYSAPADAQLSVYSLRAGTIRQRDRFVPTAQWWSRSSQSWLGKLATIERVEKQPAFDKSGKAR